MASIAAFGNRGLDWIGTILFGGAEGERAEHRTSAPAMGVDVRTSRRATYQPPTPAMAATTLLGGWSSDALAAPGDLAARGDLGAPGDGRSMASKYGYLEGGSWRDTLEGAEGGGKWKQIIESGGEWKRLLQPPPALPYAPDEVEDLATTWARASAAASKPPLPSMVSTMRNVAPPLPPPLVAD